MRPTYELQLVSRTTKIHAGAAGKKGDDLEKNHPNGKKEGKLEIMSLLFPFQANGEQITDFFLAFSGTNKSN